MSRSARFVLFGVLAVLCAALDLWTKDWAENSLGRLDHPLPLTVTAADAGKTLSELLASGPFAGADPTMLLPLSPAMTVAADDIYPLANATRDRGYYFFLTREKDKSPHFLMSPMAKAHAERRGEGFSVDDWKASWRDRRVTWAELMLEQFPFLDKEQVSEILSSGRLHPLPINLPRLKGSIVVSEGETWLLAERNIDVIPGFFRFIYAENRGAAWGILNDAPLLVRKIFLQLVSVVAMGLLLYITWRLPQDQALSAVAMALIFGGALGNFVDRFGRYYVVDFIDMYVKNAHWPTYNVADIGITAGVGLLALQILRKKSPF